jgi:hypothetical protein
VVTDFMNLKIKPTQSFGGAHRGSVYVRVFIGMSAHTYISIYVYAVFLKKNVVLAFISLVLLLSLLFSSYGLCTWIKL